MAITNGTTVENLNILDTNQSNDTAGQEIITWTEVYNALFSTTNATQTATIRDAFSSGSLKLTFGTSNGLFYTIYQDASGYHLDQTDEYGVRSGVDPYTGQNLSFTYQRSFSKSGELGSAVTSLFSINTASEAKLVTVDLDGGAGKDNMQGVLSNASIHNIIQGGAGADVMSGGLGADYFVYKSAGDSPAAGQPNSGGQLAQAWDVITNFRY